MFEGLRKKLSDAVKGLVKKEEKELETVISEVKEEKAEEPKPEIKPAPKEEKAHHAEAREVIKEEPKPPLAHAPKPEVHEKPKDVVKLSFTTKLKSVITSSVHLNDDEIEDFLENVKVSLLESDVSFETTEIFTDDLRTNLKEAKVNARNINQELTQVVRKSLFDVLAKAKQGVNVDDFVKTQIATKNIPVKILFLGPNGTGKTTTMAKIAHHFKKNGVTTVMSASDTFRAAAIEQTEHHANKVGVPVIKSTYGADPASIAFDAIAYAKAHDIQTVLIDSAGRQETNKNLINEMQKMVRVAKPDIILFVGESTAGNQLSEQIKEFNKFMKIDGIILTKLDCDAKGGNAISIANATGIPLVYIGTGESYDALVPYTPEFIVDAIMPNN